MMSQLEERFRALGTVLGLTKFKTRRDRYSTELYLYDRHALEMEIDWRENTLFFYAVHLRGGKLPGTNIIYRYSDGQPCRTFLEDIYHAKRPTVKDHRERYSEAHLMECFMFYERLISSEPEVLRQHFLAMDESI